MSALAGGRGRSSALATVVGLFVEPAEAGGEAALAAAESPLDMRPAVAVAGLRPGAGTTTLARALGVELAARDVGRAAVVTAGSIAQRAIPLGTAGASRLARAVDRTRSFRTAAIGRLCLAGVSAGDAATAVDALAGMAPLVVDVGDAAMTSVVASVCDAVVLVAAPDVEPALATVLCDSLGRVGPVPIVALNRSGDDALAEWRGRAAVEVPDSRLGARLALAGRDPHGPFGQAVSALADEVARSCGHGG